MIVSGFAGEGYKSLAEKTWPSMMLYAERVGADFIGVGLTAGRRPCSWGKLPAIAKSLSTHEESLWLDADVMVLPEAGDVFDEFLPGYAAAAAYLTDENGTGHFNCGVMLTRRGFLETLVLAAMQDDCIYNGWWEQAAINRLACPDTVQRLGEEWNSWRGTNKDVVPQFRHACGFETMNERVAWLLQESKMQCPEDRA